MSPAKELGSLCRNIQFLMCVLDMFLCVPVADHIAAAMHRNRLGPFLARYVHDVCLEVCVQL